MPIFNAVESRTFDILSIYKPLDVTATIAKSLHEATDRPEPTLNISKTKNVDFFLYVSQSCSIYHFKSHHDPSLNNLSFHAIFDLHDVQIPRSMV
jgi:hypothetical protein